MVHVTQYLAIVWKYNRSLASRDDGERAREGLFRFRTLFRHGGLLLSCVYVATCLLYGAIISGFFLSQENNPLWWRSELSSVTSSDAFRWGSGLLISMLFTSNFLHYYYDGFIWKVRHRENRENLAMVGGNSTNASSATKSWWDSARQSQVGATLFRQTLYFVPPILFLTVSFWFIRGRPEHSAPMQHMMELVQRRSTGENVRDEELQAGIERAQRQLTIETRMTQLSSAARHRTYKADLEYHVSTAELMTKALGGTLTPEDLQRHRGNLLAAKADWTLALQTEGAVAHRERASLEGMSPADQQEFLHTMLDQIEQEISMIDRGYAPIRGPRGESTGDRSTGS
jgi:hypothetical protein